MLLNKYSSGLLDVLAMVKIILNKFQCNDLKVRLRIQFLTWLRSFCVSVHDRIEIRVPRLPLIVFIYVVGIFISSPALSEVINLVCKDGAGFTVDFEVDTKKQTVVAVTKAARDVWINEYSINFTLDLPTGAYFHTISRNTGSLTVQAENGGLIQGHTCERAKRKF